MRKFFFFTIAIIIYIAATTAYQYFDLINQTIQTNIENTPDLAYINEKEPILSNEITYSLTNNTNDTNRYDELITKYENRFNELEQNILNDLSNLREEILENMSKNMNAFNFGMKLLQYEKKIRTLEEQADQQFSVFHDNLIDDLKENDFSTDIAEDFEKKYISTKARVKRDIIKQANSWLSDSEEF
ncbi:hypothetical protein ACLIA0_06040 [Bacillaceae bacterium W0354]